MNVTANELESRRVAIGGARCSRHELNGREKLKRLQRYSRLSPGRILRMRCTFIIFFLFKCHFIACSAVYKTECVLGGSRVSYHLSSFVAYKHNSTRSLTFKLFTCRSTHGKPLISCTKCQFPYYKKHDRAIVSVVVGLFGIEYIRWTVSREQKCHAATRTVSRSTKTKECWVWKR